MLLFRPKLVAFGVFAVAVSAGAESFGQDVGGAAHRCAVFGGSAGAVCDNYPDWRGGTWQPPVGVSALRVLVVGGGGGGGGSIEQGIGGNGGNSGEVVTRMIQDDGRPIVVQRGTGGLPGLGFRVAGGVGGMSFFGPVRAWGGIGGQVLLPPVGFASSGGGGAGGGFYQSGNTGGRGGAGAMGGGAGADGDAGTDLGEAVRGTEGGVGASFPALGFAQVAIVAGKGGVGGGFGSGMMGYGGGGGGGGGGVLIGGAGLVAAAGEGGAGAFYAQGGGGGEGFGAGGGGGGNYRIGAQGGAGAHGVVYVEWGGAVSALPPRIHLAAR